MHTKTRTVLLTLATLTAAGLPLAGQALAQGQATVLGQPRAERPKTERAVQGSLRLPMEWGSVEAPSAQEEAQYRLLAKVTPEQAARAAQTDVLGTATGVQLDDQDGFLVYQVVIGQTEVTVDAGNGQILRDEPLGREQADRSDAQ